MHPLAAGPDTIPTVPLNPLLQSVLIAVGNLGRWSHALQRRYQVRFTANPSCTALRPPPPDCSSPPPLALAHVQYELVARAALLSALVLSEAAGQLEGAGRTVGEVMPAVRLEGACGLVLWGLGLGLRMATDEAREGVEEDERERMDLTLSSTQVSTVLLVWEGRLSRQVGGREHGM